MGRNRMLGREVLIPPEPQKPLGRADLERVALGELDGDDGGGGDGLGPEPDTVDGVPASLLARGAVEGVPALILGRKGNNLEREHRADLRRKLDHGMKIWAAGASVRRAAELAGVAPETMRQFVRRSGIRQDATAAALRISESAEELWEAGARVAMEAIDTGEIRGVQAAIIAGIAADKVIQVDRNRKDSMAGEAAVLSKVLHRLAQPVDGAASGEVELKVTVRSSGAAVDVTPAGSGDDLAVVPRE